MPALIDKITNDIVSLTVLALMAIALIAAQAGATSQLSQGANGERPAATQQTIAVDHDTNSSSIGE